jgi:chaperone modulatory protein CbpM
VTYPLILTSAPSSRLDLATFSRIARVHPELVRRLVALGILDARRDPSGALWFGRDQLLALARIQRLRAGLGLNYSALGLVVDLLDRVAELERELRITSSRRIGGRPWTPTA